MDKQRTGGFMPPVGLGSLLTILAVLCLAVFALLAAATVRADARQGERTQQAVLDYYAADGEGQRILAALRSGQTPEGVTWQDNTACYQVPISQSQTLMVEAVVEGAGYTIARWQAVNVEQWQADDRLNVWSGEDE